MPLSEIVYSNISLKLAPAIFLSQSNLIPLNINHRWALVKELTAFSRHYLHNIDSTIFSADYLENIDLERIQIFNEISNTSGINNLFSSEKNALLKKKL